MELSQLSNLLVDQSKNLIWMIDPDFNLVYANKSYLNLMKEMTGVEKKLNEPILVEGFGEGYIEKWTAYYQRALKGQYFEIEEHYYRLEANEVQFGQITFTPLTRDDGKIVAVSCESRDITRIVKQKSEANQLIDASLDVFCTVNDQGIFVFVSAASFNQWGYFPEELIGKVSTDFILEDDVSKTKDTAADARSGKEINTFVNRYKKKDGSIAYNLWSARWDDHAKLMYAVARNGKEKLEQEEIIQQSEQRFKALVQEGSDLIGILDTEGNYVYVSPTSTAILGMKPEEFIGRNALEFIHPDDAERTLTSLQKIGVENKVMVEPFRFQNHKKEWRWIETVLTNMLDNPSVKGIVANSRDITEAVNARQQKETDELFNHTILESSPDCLKVLDTKGRLQYMNINGLCQMEIDDFEIFKNKQWLSLWGKENEVLVQTALNKALKGENAQFTAFCPTAKGTPKWWDVLVSPVKSLGEPVQQIIAVSRDITKQKKEEHRLKLLESVINNTKDSVLITEAEPLDEPGPRIIFVNEAFTKMTGYSEEEVIGKSPRMLQGPNSNKEDLSNLGKALKNWESYEITTINYKKSGEEFWVNFTVIPVADDKGWFTHWIAIERDVTEQKKSEQKIHKALEEKNNILESIGDAFFAIDNDGIVTYWNHKAELILGRTKEELLGKPLWDVYAYLTDTQFFSQFLKIIKTREIVHFEEFAPRLNIWLEVTGYPSVEGISVFLKDITNRMKAEEDIRDSDEKRRLIMNGALDAIICIDVNETITFWNPQAEVIFGWEEAEVLGQPLSKLIIPEPFRRFHIEGLKKYLKTGEGKAINTLLELSALNRNGNEFPIELTVIPIKQGGEEFFCAFIRDITERKKSAEENRFKANLLSTVGQAAIATNLDGVVNFWNNAAEAIYGWKAEEAIGKNIMELTTPETNIEQANQIMEVLKKGQTWTGQFNVRKKDGTGFAAQITNSPTYDEHNLLSGIIGISSDITEDVKNAELLKRYNLELKRSNEELEQFAFVASHDLQEPLRMISSFMDLLQRKYGTQLDQKGLQYIHFATDGAKRMKQIILDLLEFSKSNKNTDGIETVDINEILSEFKNLRRKLISEKKASIISSNLPTLNSYKAAVTQIVHCLLDNAIKYSKEDVPPIIEIIAIEHEKQWEFSIKDNGIGIDAKFYDKIFIIFQRLHNKDQYSGTGIGLSIAKRHVEFLGGKIWLESKVGVGTTFYFTISKIETHE